jgi:hypothetical protein
MGTPFVPLQSQVARALGRAAREDLPSKAEVLAMAATATPVEMDMVEDLLTRDHGKVAKEAEAKVCKAMVASRVMSTKRVGGPRGPAGPCGENDGLRPFSAGVAPLFPPVRRIVFFGSGQFSQSFPQNLHVFSQKATEDLHHVSKKVAIRFS